MKILDRIREVQRLIRDGREAEVHPGEIQAVRALLEIEMLEPLPPLPEPDPTSFEWIA